MGKHQIMSVPKEARGTFACDMFATWVGANADNGTWFIGGVIAACGFAVAMKVLALSSAVSYLCLSLIGYIGYKTGVSTMEPSRIFFQFWMILFYFRVCADRILESPVDKKEAFPPFFVCFRDRADRIWRVQ